jgi:hypothetical protein
MGRHRVGNSGRVPERRPVAGPAGWARPGPKENNYFSNIFYSLKKEPNLF